MLCVCIHVYVCIHIHIYIYISYVRPVAKRGVSSQPSADSYPSGGRRGEQGAPVDNIASCKSSDLPGHERPRIAMGRSEKHGAKRYGREKRSRASRESRRRRSQRMPGNVFYIIDR